LRVVGAWLQLQTEELPEQDLVGLIPTNASQKCTKTEMWKIPLGFVNTKNWYREDTDM
jgi:hypothetical protein